jgi:hypothetical protein
MLCADEAVAKSRKTLFRPKVTWAAIASKYACISYAIPASLSRKKERKSKIKRYLEVRWN